MPIYKYSINNFCIGIQGNWPSCTACHAGYGWEDESFDFTYNEFEPLLYNRNSFDSNLISTIVFYVNVILGVDLLTNCVVQKNLFTIETQKITFSGVSQKGKRSSNGLIRHVFSLR
mgnify:CR=1 FL=1